MMVFKIESGLNSLFKTINSFYFLTKKSKVKRLIFFRKLEEGFFVFYL